MTVAAAPAGESRAPAPEVSVLPRTAVPSPLPAGPSGLNCGAVLALQRTAGNAYVARALGNGAALPKPGQTAAPEWPQDRSIAGALASAGRARLDRCPGCGGTCGCEEEAEPEADEERDERERERVSAKVAGGEDELIDAPPPDTVHVETVVMNEEEAEPAPTEAAAAAAAKCGVTATATVSSGAAGSIALPATWYGLTWPESVDVTITACKDGGNWVPGVVSLVGRYSLRTRLLAGQSEVTGPAGNSKKSNFCKQVEGLDKLGNDTSIPWYMLSAVLAHEQVHETRLGPAMAAATAAIVASLEGAASLPDDGKMKQADALKAIQGDAGFKAAVKKATDTWKAEYLTRIAGDHAAGGPTDKAERSIVDPMIAAICAEAKKSSWGACASCPP